MATLQQMVMQPSPLGELFASMADILGPASYTAGTPQKYSAQNFALQTFKFAVGGIDESGVYKVEFVSISGPGASTINARFSVVSTGAEYTGAALSGLKFRVLAIGN